MKLSLNTIDPGFPYTTLTSGSVVVRGTGAILIIARATTATGDVITPQIRVNGTTVATGTAANQSNLTHVYPAHNGDLLTLWETDDGSGVDNVSGGQNNIYLHYESAITAIGMGLFASINRAALY